MKRRIFTVLQIVLSLALLALAVAIARPSNLREQFRGASRGWLAASFLVVPVLIMLRAGRWHILARTRAPGIRFSRSFHSYMAGLALAVVTPFAAGELARGAFAAPEDKAGFVGLTFLDKMLDVSSLLVLACLGFVVVAPGPVKLAGVAALALLFAGLAFSRRIAGLAAALMPQSRITVALQRALAAAQAVPSATLAGCFVVALANFTLLYCHLFMIMYAFAPGIDPRAAGLFPLITLSRVIPSIAGLGVREFTAGAIFAQAQYSVTSAGAVVAAFWQFTSANVLPAVAWLVVSGGFRRFVGNGREEKSDEPGKA